MNPLWFQLAAVALFGLFYAAASNAASEVREISFQEFKTTLLEQGLVERVEVSNKTRANVYVKPSQGSSSSSSPGHNGGAALKYGFNI